MFTTDRKAELTSQTLPCINFFGACVVAKCHYYKKYKSGITQTFCCFMQPAPLVEAFLRRHAIF